MINPNAGRSNAAIFATAAFVDVTACSQFRLIVTNRELSAYQLHEPVGNEELGVALLECLRLSTTPTLEEFQVLRANATANYEQWVAATIEAFGYSSRRKLFAAMKHVSACCERGQITLRPSRRERAEGFGGDGFTDSDNVLVSVGSGPSDVCMAIRTALARCK